MPMVDIGQVTEHFLGNALQMVQLEYGEIDQNCIRAIHNLQQDNQNRIVVLINWMNAYHVLRFDGQYHNQVAQAVINYSDNHNRPENLQGDNLFDAYRQLYQACAQAAPHLNNDHLRDVTSLVSKALWCMYPLEVPIFDARTNRAVCILGRLMEYQPVGFDSYERFANMWRNLYQCAQPVIENAELNGYQYHARVFDGVLWHVGGLW